MQYRQRDIKIEIRIFYEIKILLKQHSDLNTSVIRSTHKVIPRSLFCAILRVSLLNRLSGKRGVEQETSSPTRFSGINP